jgi:uncharacterized protein (DUF2141 family)
MIGSRLDNMPAAQHKPAMRRPLILALAPVLLAAGPGNAPVVVAVSGITGSHGRVHVDICPEQRFTKEGCPWVAEAPAVAGTTLVTVPGVPPGRYAAQAYYDANGNGKADRNMIGMPTELIGFSNDVRVHFSRPNFADAAFVHGSSEQRIAFSVHKIP